jgi:hypothetical protein
MGFSFIHTLSGCFVLLTLAKTGGATRVRTEDLSLAKAALSQLSYSPL